MENKYLKKKFREIEAEVAVAVGFACFGVLMFGHMNDSIIKERDKASDNIEKIVKQILKYYGTKI